MIGSGQDSRVGYELSGNLHHAWCRMPAAFRRRGRSLGLVRTSKGLPGPPGFFRNDFWSPVEGRAPSTTEGLATGQETLANA